MKNFASGDFHSATMVNIHNNSLLTSILPLTAAVGSGLRRAIRIVAVASPDLSLGAETHVQFGELNSRQ